MVDQLPKDAASNRDGETVYSKIPKRAVIKEIKEKGEIHWQQERGNNKIILSKHR
jgi:hypothetical protein